MAIFALIPALRPPAKYGSDNVIITWQDNTFFTVQFRDMQLKVMGIPNAEEVLDAVKDYVENGEVWVQVNAHGLSFAAAVACLFEDSAPFVCYGPSHRFLRPAIAELVSGGPLPLPLSGGLEGVYGKSCGLSALKAGLQPAEDRPLRGKPLTAQLRLRRRCRARCLWGLRIIDIVLNSSFCEKDMEDFVSKGKN